MNLRSGDVDTFDTSWRIRPETKRYHFKRGKPDHQVQFAFQNHWRVFRSILGNVRSGVALEVGAGRGSMAAFFADAGFDTCLLDTSATALASGRYNFERDDLSASYIVGDVLRLPFDDNSVDVITSIGLMEHFDDVRTPCAEQIRILKPGGVLLNYIVPERAISVQTLAIPINLLLRLIHWLGQVIGGKKRATPPAKPALYRNEYDSKHYLEIYRSLGLDDVGSYGTFPMPLVSHSYDFPFSPMSPDAEKVLMACWRVLLGIYGAISGRDPWTCPERWGLAFVVWGKKSREEGD
ncbi:MAG: class I SAM-dependent methyltransferase [Anaerolineae bacterium]|nr:class I SAM-dependent methyltransferase [Anaerolineae bacterium]